jgi:hypothetical protein
MTTDQSQRDTQSLRRPICVRETTGPDALAFTSTRNAPVAPSWIKLAQAHREEIGVRRAAGYTVEARASDGQDRDVDGELHRCESGVCKPEERSRKI